MSEDPTTKAAADQTASEPSTPSKSKSAPKDKEESSGLGDAFFSIQKFVVGRAWSLLLLTLIGEIGGFVIHKSWDGVSQPTGRNIVQVVLLVLGLLAFWIVPTRAGFMRRLCFLLVFAGAVLAAATWGFEVLGGRALRDGHFEAVRDTWIGELGLSWLMYGVFLAILMWGGRYVFRKWQETPDAQARRSGRKSRDDDSPHG